ncbi:GNAT family N-acetyltransferase [Streptomyces tanashiensis]|uniref:GNAT family N-acetyltransferase n=1 Tax=Streptomyces tanashiensis TaxID=67367 RepID=UPI0036E963AA
MYPFAVEERENGALVASVNVHRHADTWGIGYWTVAEHRGRDHATEAVLALANWSFKERGVQRLEWRAEAGNMVSWAVAQKARFVREGIPRATRTNSNSNSNSLRDTWTGALLPSDLGSDWSCWASVEQRAYPMRMSEVGVSGARGAGRGAGAPRPAWPAVGRGGSARERGELGRLGEAARVTRAGDLA